MAAPDVRGWRVGSSFARLANNLPFAARCNGRPPVPSVRGARDFPRPRNAVALHSRFISASPSAGTHFASDQVDGGLRGARARAGRPEIAAGGRVMLAQVVRGVVRVSATLVLGAIPGALYAALVGAVHRGVSGRWDRAFAFALGCSVVGALLGLLGGARWAFAGTATSGPGLPRMPGRPHVPAEGRGRSFPAPLARDRRLGRRHYRGPGLRGRGRAFIPGRHRRPRRSA